MDINGYRGGSGGGAGRRVVAADLYRHVPKELSEATKIGVVMSLLSLLTMVILFTCETWSFVRTQVAASVEVDPSADTLLRLNFNVTLYDVECEYVSVDVWDRLGTNLQNVTKDITKWHVDPRGKQQAFHGRNKQQQAVQHEQHKETLQDIKDMNEGELHATDLSPETIQEFHKANHLTFVDYFAPWCIWCQRLAPTWEKFAAEAKKQQIAVGVGKVDCVEHQQMCKDERVMAFPTLRWYEDGKAVLPDYKGDRTVGALLEYAKKKADKAEGDDDDSADDDASDWEHHPGCQVSGHLMVNRVPGNLHIEAKSIHHDWNSALVNLTHRVNHLSFGSQNGPQGHHLNFLAFFSDMPAEYRHTNPLAGRYYPVYKFHEAFHHHLKIVSTRVEYLFSDTVVYQILAESQLIQYDVMEMPEIKFLWNLSPMGMNLTKEGPRWYEYITSLLAIIGGTYTTLGLINATLLRIFRPKKL
ncbi:hypothetical protein ACHAXT_000060 [Thalassiosira profunda]